MIVEIKQKSELPMALLLLADPELDKIQSYIEKSRVLSYQKAHETVGVIVWSKVAEKRYEIMNIAVAEKCQGQGIGKQLIEYLLSVLAKEEKQTVKILVKTGETSQAALALYHSCGFVVKSINQDYFRKNYQEAIYENGYLLRDQIVLEKRLYNRRKKAFL